MPKSKMFVGSSVEQLNLAYAVQEGLEHDLEITVWPQGVFALSKTALASLMQELDKSDFGLFILAPDDITRMRDTNNATVRDNVIFELGLFIGRLGVERCFIFVPRNAEELHLPSDLLGLGSGVFEPNRQDGNLVAALGPACNNVRRIVQQLGPFKDAGIDTAPGDGKEIVLDGREDCIALIQGWMGSRPISENRMAFKFRDVDRQLGLAPGSSEKYIEEAARVWGLRVAQRGNNVILFE